MKEPTIRARYFMQYEFKRRTHPVDALSEIKWVLDEDEKIDITTCRHWFRRFRMGNQSVENEPNPRLYWKSKPPNEVFYDIFLFLDRVDLGKCQLLNNHFDTIIIAGRDVLPVQTIQKIRIEKDQQIHQIHMESEDYKDCYGQQSLDNPFIRSLKNCIIRDLQMIIKETLLLERLFDIMGEPLKSIECHISTFNNIKPAKLIETYTKYVRATNIEFNCQDFLLYYIKNYEQLQLSPMPKTLTIRSVYSDMSTFNVDDIRRFFLGLKYANYKLILLFGEKAMLIDYFVIPFIWAFKEIEQPCQLIRNIAFNWLESDDRLFEEYLQRISQMKMVQQFINETIDDNDDKRDCIYNGMLKRDNWLLNLKIKIHCFRRSDIVSYDVQLNVEEAKSQ